MIRKGNGSKKKPEKYYCLGITHTIITEQNSLGQLQFQLLISSPVDQIQNHFKDKIFVSDDIQYDTVEMISSFDISTFACPAERRKRPSSSSPSSIRRVTHNWMAIVFSSFTTAMGFS